MSATPRPEDYLCGFDPNFIVCKCCSFTWPITQNQPTKRRSENELDHWFTYECPNCHDDVEVGVRGLIISGAAFDYDVKK